MAKIKKCLMLLSKRDHLLGQVRLQTCFYSTIFIQKEPYNFLLYLCVVHVHFKRQIKAKLQLYIDLSHVVRTCV